MKTLKQILLNEEVDDADDLDRDIYDDDDLFEKMLDFILELDTDSLSDEKASMLDEILEEIENYSDEEGMEEAVAKRKVRRDKKAQRERSRKYRKNKSRLKLKARKFRRSARGKQLAKKRKRMSKLGKTATGKRKRKFIN